MSRSHRKSPCLGNTTARSEKGDKQLAHRRERAHQRQLLARDPDGPPFAGHPRSGGWTFSKDGRRWYGDTCPPKLLRK